MPYSIIHSIEHSSQNNSFFFVSELACMANRTFTIDLEGGKFGNQTGCCEILQNNLTYSIWHNIDCNSFFSAIFGDQG